MAQSDDRLKADRPPEPEQTAERPAYEPPRIEKKRSLLRATLFTGSGPSSGGLVGPG